MPDTKSQIKNWQKIPLGDYLDFYNGKSIKPDAEGAYPVYGSNGKIGGSNESLYENALIIGRVGAYCGSIQYEHGKFWASDNTIVAKTKKGGLECFAYYLLQNLNLNNYAGGAAQPLVTQVVLKQIMVNIPAPSVQKQIANVLSIYDDLIKNNTKRINILEEIAGEIYKEWFVYFRFPSHEKIKIVDSKTEFGKIPAGWNVGKLDDIGELIKRAYTDKDDNLPLVDMSRMQSGTLAINEVGKSSDLSTSRITFSKDDLLFGSIRTYLHKVALAPFIGITNTSVFVIRPRATHFKALLTISVFRREAIDWTNQYSTGTKMPVIKWETMRGMPIMIPASPILENFQNSVWPMLEKIQDFYYINANLHQSRDLLLPKLVNGEIKV